MSAWDWELWDRSSEPFTDKEQFFSNLYSLTSLSSKDQVETSEVSLAIAASKNQRYKRIIRRSSRIPASSAPIALKMSGSINIPKVSSTTPVPLDPTTRSSPPPESSRILAIESKGIKRKRAPKVTSIPKKKQIFCGMYFYFVPNDLKNPVRKFRVQKTDEHGGFCLKEWREKKKTRLTDEIRAVIDITHVIVDAKLQYSDVLKYLQRESIPVTPRPLPPHPPPPPPPSIMVNDTFIGDCLAFSRVVDYEQPQYKVSGYSSIPLYHSKLISPTLLTCTLPLDQSDSSSSTQSPQIKPARSRKPIETPRETQEDSPKTAKLALRGPETPGESKPEGVSLMAVGSRASDLPSQQLEAELEVEETERTPREKFFCSEKERPEDELDFIIAEVMKMGDPPLDDDQYTLGIDHGDKNSFEEESSSHIIKKRKPTPSPKTKNPKWQDKFQCMHSNDGQQSRTNPNARTIEVLSEMQKYYEMIKDPWRSISYRKGINTLKRQERKIFSASEARSLPMIGDSLAQKIEEIVKTDHLRKLEYAQLEPGDTALKLFLGIYGVGPSLASQWVQAGYKTLQDLLTNVRLSTSQKVGIDHYDDFTARIPRAEVKRHGDVVMETAVKLDQNLQLEIMGSYRRGAKDCGDIDIMITKEGASAHEISGLLSELVERLVEIEFLMCGLATPRSRDGGSKWHGVSKLLDIPQWRRIDLLAVPWDERGAALLYFTGNDIFNRSMRLLASKKGYGLNQRGLFKDIMRGPERQKLNKGTKVAGESEEQIFKILGVPYRRPEERIC